MYREDYMQLVNEYFDIQDTETRKCLLSINEADQNQVMAHLAAGLYQMIIKRVDEIDFGKIPQSKGDIANIPNFQDINNTLNIVRDVILEEKQSTASIDTIFTAIDNMRKYKSQFQKAFSLNCDIIMTMYNVLALSIVSATSIYIASTVEMIKDPVSNSVEMHIDKVAKAKSKDKLLMDSLSSFNKSCEKGDMEKILNTLLTNQKSVRESVMETSEPLGVSIIREYYQSVNEAIPLVGAVGAALKAGSVVKNMGIIIAVLTGSAIIIKLLIAAFTWIHSAVVMLFNCKQSLANYLEGEADIIRLNAEKVQYDRTKTPEQRKKIIEKQMKIADHFKAWADKLTVSVNKASKDSESDIKKDKASKSKITDVVDEIPDSADIF